jgi:hypothetical protein
MNSKENLFVFVCVCVRARAFACQWSISQTEFRNTTGNILVLHTKISGDWNLGPEIVCADLDFCGVP